MIEINNKVRVFSILFLIEIAKCLILLLIFRINIMNLQTILIAATLSLADILLIKEFIKNG